MTRTRRKPTKRMLHRVLQSPPSLFQKCNRKRNLRLLYFQCDHQRAVVLKSRSRCDFYLLKVQLLPPQIINAGGTAALKRNLLFWKTLKPDEMGHRENSKNKSNGRETLEREDGYKRQTPMFQQKYTIRYGGSTALITAYCCYIYFLHCLHYLHSFHWFHS